MCQTVYLSLCLPQYVLRVSMCDMKSGYRQNPRPLLETFQKPDTSLHKTRNGTFSTNTLRHGKSMFLITNEISSSNIYLACIAMYGGYLSFGKY